MMKLIVASRYMQILFHCLQLELVIKNFTGKRDILRDLLPSQCHGDSNFVPDIVKFHITLQIGSFPKFLPVSLLLSFIMPRINKIRFAL